MRKKVCMFVWNHFTNDARVLRECTTLSANGFDVDLICIGDKGLLNYEEHNSHFKVYRVRRYPVSLQLLQKVYRGFAKRKLVAVLALTLLAYVYPLGPLLTLLILLLVKTKLSTLWIRGSIFTRMVARGFLKNYNFYHSNDLNTLPQGFVCAKLRYKKKLLIYDSHEVQTSRTGYEGAFHGKLEAFLIRKVDSMIVENHTRAKYNEDLYGFYPHVVHNYPFKLDDKIVKKAFLHQILGLPKEEKILLYQGGIQTGRGLDKLIMAARLFREGTLVFIGDGRIKPELIKLVREMNLEKKVKFLPKVPLEDLPSYTQNAYLGFQVLNNVCFNHFSASSNKLFEYMMSGVPVVACSFPEIKHVVEGEKIGLCIDSHNHLEIARAVNILLERTYIHEEMKRNCLSVRTKYNWEAEQIQFLNVYQRTGT
ncbi:glycosyltransferase [Anaerobacillus alkaliphilus]|uniref:Glycosyltransferase n=1 Tax=Anaerobacillus alkaliphilus TaxID=1548597 RepID=A0A4Q0VU18_9BACI|nr:glycosyltransferase [Anaerobacillus alkaliphilus]RXJ01671.1 glycosyltransferase [Anaerobacillus alkaliphilus]